MSDVLAPTPRVDVDWAFARYESVRPRLPVASFPEESVMAATLADVADRYDAFVLDSFGVLNVGETAIPGAVARMAELRRSGKRSVVLTNSATQTRTAALAKYRSMGFDFTAEEVISSRDVAAARLATLAPGAVWAAASGMGDSFADIPAEVIDLLDRPDAFETADGFLLLSSARWTKALNARLARALADWPRPVVVANPDLVAPREAGLSLEPGAFAHDLADAVGVEPVYFGKPFPEAFDEARQRLDGVASERIAMVGDTLHTDVLGGRAAGLGTVLIAAHGLYAGRELSFYIRRSGIYPDVIAQTI